MSEPSNDQRNKQHKTRLGGAKLAKKELHRKERLGLETEPNRGKNNKAFTGPGAGSRKTQQALRSLEKKSSHIHMPVDDKQQLGLIEDPPMLVVVVGPPQCGKSTLIRSMTKFYASRNIQRLRGPVTVVAGRSRRVTFLEIPNTLSAMCDAAKIADLVIIMVDGAFGFEMETFEFLNIAQVHGFPKIIGVVSHLDKMKTNKQLKKTKRLLRHRFWHEVAEGCKLVCLAPMINGIYRNSDVLKLHRLLVTTTPKIQNWRNTHGCVLLDRYEDITDSREIERNENCSRTIAFYGYVRGHAIKPNQPVHIPGLGDFEIAHLSRQEDPCVGVEHSDKSAGNKLRHLSTKQKKIYAPHCDLGGVVYDEDAVYVYEDEDRQNTSRSGEGLQMLRDLQRAGAIDAQMVRRPMAFADEDTMEMDIGEVQSGSDDDNDEEGSDYEDLPNTGARRRGAGRDDLADFAHLGGDDADEDAEGGEEDDGLLAPRHPHGDDTVRINKRTTRFDWSDPVYQQKLKAFFVTGSWKPKGDGEDEDEEGAEANEGSEADSKGYESIEDEAELYKAADGADEDASDDDAESADGEDDDAPAAARRKGPGGKKMPMPALKAQKRGRDGAPVAASNDAPYAGESDMQGLLDFFIEKDLRQDSAAADFMAEITGGLTRANGDGEDGEDDVKEAELIQQHGEGAAEVDDYIQKKMAKKKAFDSQYDEGTGKNNTTQYYQSLLDDQAQKKRALHETMEVVGDDLDKRIGLVGFFAGLYVRMVVKGVPVEFVKNFDPTVPLFAGALNAGEDQLGMVQGRLKRHRWYPRILKAQDPIVISIGWRRVQTQPIFAVDDPNGRHRYLKYTPKHMHCMCAFYGPIVPPNTGFVVIPSKNARSPFFRLTASGFTIGVEHGATVVKKLKLTGVPEKIQKTTCFVKGMFTSDIEAAKFVGAKVKAVSGLRGIIKKVLKGKNGIVRCSFEDKLLMSDIVFLRSWKAVEPPRYCVNVLNALNPDWEGMRSMAQLRRDLDIPLVQRRESEYTEIKNRRDVGDEPMKIAMSRTLRMNLPFQHKEEFIPLVQERGLAKRVKAATTVAPEPHEMRKKALLDTLTKQETRLDDHQKGLRHERRKKAVVMHKQEVEKMDRKIKVAKKEHAKREEFKSQHKSRASAGKKH
jgi:ribosome biogenesis protein BMS1